MSTMEETHRVGTEVATLGGGCFWCLEAVFKDVTGVERVVSGYSAGHTPNPTYEEVCTGETGHAEVVQITFNPAVISFRKLLEIFFTIHDPTTLNRQGADVGTQYRSIILYHSPAQRDTALEVIEEIGQSGIWADPIVTQVETFERFYPAEEYHANYFERNPNQPYCRVVIAPKVQAFRRKHADKLKSRS